MTGQAIMGERPRSKIDANRVIGVISLGGQVVIVTGGRQEPIGLQIRLGTFVISVDGGR